MSFWNANKKPPTSSATTGSSPSLSSQYSLNEPAPSGVPQSPLERFGHVKSALGPGTSIQGKLSFDTPVRIDGHLSGQVQSSQALLVGKSGRIEATIVTKALIVEGAVKGQIEAKDRIEVLPGGSLEGEIKTPVIVIHEGSRFDGTCNTK